MPISASLQGKRALVTGASSDGFGRYFAEVLGEAGAEVVVTARRLEALENTANALRAEGYAARAAALDVTDAGACAGLVQRYGPFDIVVNNAGCSVRRSILDQDEAAFDAVLDTNLKGVWNVSMAVARQLVDLRRPGSIINIASITGLRQVAGNTPYAISKAGVIQLTKQLALEFACDGIRVNALAPGYFESDLTRDFLASPQGQALAERIPMKRFGDYPSLRGPLLLLADEHTSFMTGAVLTIDGGHVLSSL